MTLIEIMEDTMPGIIIDRVFSIAQDLSSYLATSITHASENNSYRNTPTQAFDFPKN